MLCRGLDVRFLRFCDAGLNTAVYKHLSAGEIRSHHCHPVIINNGMWLFIPTRVVWKKCLNQLWIGVRLYVSSRECSPRRIEAVYEITRIILLIEDRGSKTEVGGCISADWWIFSTWLAAVRTKYPGHLLYICSPGYECQGQRAVMLRCAQSDMSFSFSHKCS